MTNEEKAQTIVGDYCNREHCLECGGSLSVENGCYEFQQIMEMAEWKDKQYSDVIEMLIDELNTSKLYHLGITGLDTDEEAAEKRRKGECSLIRGIERAINYAELVIEKK